jgi:pyruvate kinase
VPPIFALSSVEKTIRRMSLLWGVNPLQCQKMLHTDQMVDTAERLLSESGQVRDGQILGMVAGTRTKSGSTNFLRLHTVGDSDRLSRRPSKPSKPKKKKAKASRQSAATASTTQVPQK